MKLKKYSSDDLTKLMIEFHENHPRKNVVDEWYDDCAIMTTDCVAEFIHWLNTGSYDGPTNEIRKLYNDPN